MLMSVLLYRKQYSLLDYLCVSLIAGGIYIFFTSSVPTSHNSKSPVDHHVNSLFGIILSLISLFCDGLTGSQQDYYVNLYQPDSNFLMFKMNLYSVFILFLPSIFTSQLFDGFSFVISHPNIIWDILLFSLVSVFGQWFIFHMVTSFGALPLSIVTSSRKFMTILSSIIFFGHPIETAQWIGVAAVFGGLMLDIGQKIIQKRRKEKQKEKEK